jgi:hypothetical protein
MLIYSRHYPDDAIEKKSFFILKTWLLLTLRPAVILERFCPAQRSDLWVRGKRSPWRQRDRPPPPRHLRNRLDRHRSDFAYLAPLSPPMPRMVAVGLYWSPLPVHVMFSSWLQGKNQVLILFWPNSEPCRQVHREVHWKKNNLFFFKTWFLSYSIFVSAWSKALKLLSTECFGPLFSPTPPVICTKDTIPINSQYLWIFCKADGTKTPKTIDRLSLARLQLVKPECPPTLVNLQYLSNGRVQFKGELLSMYEKGNWRTANSNKNYLQESWIFCLVGWSVYLLQSLDFSKIYLASLIYRQNCQTFFVIIFFGHTMCNNSRW